MSGDGYESDSSTNTNTTFGQSIDGDIVKPTIIFALKQSKQVTKPKGSHHCFAETSGNTIYFFHSFT